MSARKHTLAVGLLAALIHQGGFAQADPVKVLIEQGQYWQARGNGERAQEAWQKLLRLNPNQPDALAGMAQIELDAGRAAQARTYLDQLKKAAPSSPLVARLEQSINLGQNSPQLRDARQLARGGQAEEAVANYRAALGGRTPEGPLALEYYQTLGGTPQGWEEARRGLERLAKESPNDERIALALAQHLTYREATRRDGIRQLARLSSQSTLRVEATDSWRKALAWIGTRAADIPLYEAYLAVNPEDAAIRGRLEEINKQRQENRRADIPAPVDPLRQRNTAGFAALDAGNLAQAESDFTTVLNSRPNDPDALGGLGVLRLRQENFGQARELLERASRSGPAGRWKSALNSATYWTLVEQAAGARSANNYDGARQLLEQAVKLDPKEATAQNALADVFAQMGRFNEAEAAYRRVLAVQADNPDAIRGMVGVMAQNDKPDQALQLIERLSPAQQEQVGELGRLRAAQAIGVAKAAAQRGDDMGARLAYEDALLNDPNSPWIRLDLARLYMKMGALNDARGVMDGLLISNPDMPEGLYASALLAAEMQDWRGALSTLDSIPTQNRTRDIAALQKRVWVHTQADTASSLAKQGRNQEAIAMLSQAEQFAGQDPELLGAIASAYTDAGDGNRALGMIRQVMARTTRPEPGLRLQYAAILLKTRQDVELAGILRQLQNQPLSQAERKSFNEIRRAYVVRQADGLREAGDLVAAYDTLAPVIAETPDDTQVVGSLARMFAQAGDYPQALGLYNRLLQKDPNNIETLIATTSMATSAKEYAYAESTIDWALAQAPQNPDVLTAAGRLYRAQGKNSKAAQFLSAAVQAQNQLSSVPGAYGQAQASAAPAARSGNPFAGRPGQRPTSALAPQAAAPAAQQYPAGGYQPPPIATPVNYQPQAHGQFYIPPPAGANRFAPQGTINPQAAVAQQGYTPYGQPQPTGPMNPAAYYQEQYGSNTQTTAPAAMPAAAPRATGNSRTPAPASRTTPARNTGTPARNSTAPASGNLNAGANAANQAYLPPATAANNPAYLPPANAQGYAPAGQAYIPSPLTAQAPQASTPTPFFAGSAAQARAPAAYGAPQTATAPAWNSTGPGGFPYNDPNRPRTVLDELNEIEQDRSPVISAGVVGRTRQGEPGLGDLSEVQAPIEFRFPAGDGKIALRATPVTLDAGTPSRDYNVSSRFGGGPAAGLAQAAGGAGSAGSQSQSGIGFGIAYETERLQADLGTTPLGFRYTDVSGGIKLKGPINNELSYTVDLSRRPVTDSLLSFAGARDNRTGQTWGGVSATGGRLEVGWDDGSYGLYGYGSFHSMNGNNVVSNTRIEGGGGMYWRLVKSAGSDLTAGVNLTALSFDKNLRYFTFGHGGYFSPQEFLSVSLPLSWTQRTGRLSYQVKGSLGIQSFKEDAAPYYPGSSSLQAAAQQAAIDATSFGLSTSASATYAGQTKTGLGYNIGAAAEYQIAPQLFLGGQFAMDNASDYRQLMGGLYLRYALQPMTGQPTYPVNPYRSQYMY